MAVSHDGSSWAVMAAVSEFRPSPSARYNPRMHVDGMAPDFELPDLDAQTHRLSDYRGRIVVLNFWSCTCPHAERTDELIETWKQGWQKEVGVIRIAANASETILALRQAAQRKHIAPVLLDRMHAVADAYGAQTTPHVFVIDASGRLRYRGAVDDTYFSRRVPTRFFLEEAVRAILDGKSPSVSETQPYGCALIRQALE